MANREDHHKNNLVGSSPADFEKLGNAEMTVVLNAVSSGTVTVAKKGGKIVVEAAKKVKLKADFDPSLNVQTNGFLYRLKRHLKLLI